MHGMQTSLQTKGMTVAGKSFVESHSSSLPHSLFCPPLSPPAILLFLFFPRGFFESAHDGLGLARRKTNSYRQKNTGKRVRRGKHENSDARRSLLVLLAQKTSHGEKTFFKKKLNAQQTAGESLGVCSRL